MATYITWEDLARKSATIEELRQELASLPRLQVVQACAVINTVLKTWQGSIDLNEHEQLLRIFFSKQFADQCNDIARTFSPRRFVFHRQQLLLLIREAIVHSPNSPDMGDEFRARLAKCCLYANDLLGHGLAMNPNMNQVERLLPEFTTIYDFSDQQSILRKTARARIFLEEIVNRPDIRSRSEFVDLGHIFSTGTGLTIREYSNLLFGVLTKYVKFTLAQYAQQPKEFDLSKHYFRDTHLQAAKIATFFQDVSATFEGIQGTSVKAKHRSDFTALKDRPLMQIGDDSYFPLDVGFIIDKLETGVFWRVHAACSGDTQKQNLHTFWGHLFQRYVTELLERNCRGDKHRFIPELTGAAGAELWDGAIVSGSNLVLMEYKGSMLTGDAKYSGEPQRLMEELNLKFIGTAESPKGAGQLARAITRYWNKKNPKPPEGIASPAKIYPVIVARDNALGSPFVNKYLNERFRGLYNRKNIRPVVTPLFVLTIDELETIAPHLGYVELSELLEAKYKNDPRLDWPFSVVANEVLDK